MNRRIVLVGAATLLLALLGLMLAGGLMLARWWPALARPRIASTAAVVTQIQSLSQLVTVKYVFEKVVILDDVKWYGQNRVLIVAHGIVKAGVDLHNVSKKDVTISGSSISLRLPQPLLLDAYLDESKTEVVERTTGLLRMFDQKMEQEARRQALEQIRKSARAAGILRDAEDRTRLQLMALARAAGFTEVEITFE